jgi:uncharacterized membrane protein
MEDRIKSLEEAVRALSLRLSKLEGNKTPPNEVFSRPSIPKKIPPVSPVKVESTMGMSKLLAIVAVVCFVLAGSFIVKLAIESGWLTAERQWGLTVLLGVSLCAAGRFLTVTDLTYRSYLSAAGLIVLYIAAYSSSLHFKVVSEDVSLFLGMIVTALGLGIFHYHRSEIFPVVTVVGTYLSVLLLTQQSFGLPLEAGFFILWAFLFSWISTFFHSRLINLLATYHGLGVFSYLHMRESDPSIITGVIVLLVMQYGIFLWGVAQYTLRNKVTLKTAEAWSYFPALCFFYGVTYYFINLIAPDLAPWIGLAIAASFLLFYELVKKNLQGLNAEASQMMVHSFLALVIFQAGYLQLLPGAAKPWLLPILLIMTYVSEQRKTFPKVSLAFRIFGFVIGGLEFLGLLGKLLDQSNSQELLVAFITLGMGIFYYLNLGKLTLAREKGYLSLVHILAVLAIFRLCVDYGSLAVTIGWAIYAILILTAGYVRKDRTLVSSSLVVMFIAAGKVLVFDGSGAPTSVRIGSLLFTGALLFGSGVLFRKMQEWNSQS